METKKISKLIYSACVIMFIFLLTSCTKTEVQGPQGTPGNATVKVYEYTIDSTQWRFYNGISIYVDVPAKYITQNIYDSGTVLVYMNYMNNGDMVFNGWNALPYSIAYAGITYSYVYSVGNIALWIISSGSYLGPYNIKYKVVVIQGAVTSSTGTTKNKKAYIPPDLNTKNYYEVKNYFHLSD